MNLSKALDILTIDMHVKSKRPCSTCATVSEALGHHFGCSTVNGYRMSGNHDMWHCDEHGGYGFVSDCKECNK